MIVCPFGPSPGSAFPAAQHPFIPTILLQAVGRGFLLVVSAILLACSSARNAEFDQLIADGDFVQAKQLMQRLLDEYSVRDDNPTLPLRRAQAYYWLAYAHGRLAEYDSMNIALLECLSHDEGFSDERLDLMREFASREEALGVMAFNEGEYNSARKHFKTAAGILSADNAHRQVSRHILRNLAFTEAASGNPAGAGSYLTEAFGLGDERSGSLLGHLRSEGSISVPPRIEPFSGDTAETEEVPRGTDGEIAKPGPVRHLTDSVPPPNDLKEPDKEAWTIHVLDAQYIRDVPHRGTDEYLPFLNGVSSVNGGLHIRGSRDGETGYLLEDISVLNPFTNEEGVPLLPEAIESIELHSGAYGASLGSWGGGTVVSRMKTGGERLNVFVDLRGDDLAPPGKQFAGTSPFGYKNVAATVDGPLPLEAARFFVAGEYIFLRDRDPMFLAPFRYDLVTDDLGSYPPGTPLPGPVAIARNHLPGNWLERTTVQGNVAFSVAGVDLTLIGSYRNEVHPEGGRWPDALRRIFVQDRNPLNKATTRFAALKAGVHLTPKTRADVSVAWYDRFHRIYDPDFRHNFRVYTDSLANAQLGYGGFFSRYFPPPSYSVVFNFGIDHPSTPNNSYTRENQSSLEFSAGVKHQVLDEWRVEAGGRLSLWTMRLYRIQNIRSFMMSPWLSSTFEQERRIRLMRAGDIATAGYRYDDPSVEVNDGPDGPIRPDFGSIYVRNLLTFDVATIDVGLRYESIDADLTAVPRTVNPSTGQEDWQEVPFDGNLDMLIEDALTKTPAYEYVLPRIGITFAPSKRTMARVAYGSYVQLRKLEDLYMHNVTLSTRMDPFARVPYNLGASAIPFMAEPERSQHFEAGLDHFLDSGISLKMAYYRKSMDNQLQLEQVANSAGTPIFVALRNGGKGVSSGLEFSADIPLGRYISAGVWYTYSRTEGRIFDPHDWRYVSDDFSIRQYPESLIPADYDQTHRGTMIGRFVVPHDDESFLTGTSLSLIFSFRSGQRYTALAPPLFLGTASPWNVGVRVLTDYRSATSTSFQNEVTTPWYYNFDLRFRKSFFFSPLTIELVLDILNLFDRKHVLNVFPTTGHPNDDGWLQQTGAEPYKALPLYEEFYRTVILDNRWAYMNATGNDIYGTPRQIRLGLTVRY